MLELLRDIYTEKNTIGELYLDGDFICDTLEDTVRVGIDGVMKQENKVSGQTAIPCGTYEVIVNRSQRFNQEMPLLLNVPYFQGIRIHPGNTEKNTEGCILVGERANGSNGSFLINSRRTYDSIVFPKIKNALKLGRLYISIRNA